MIIFRLFFVLLMWGVGIVFLMLLVRAIVNSGNQLGSQQVQDKLQKTLTNLITGLVPFERDERKELGRDFQETEVNKNFSYGYFSTIFKEPVLAFAKILTSKGGCQIMGETTEIKCELRFNGHQTAVYIGGKVYGKIDKNGILTDTKKRAIVNLDCNSYPLYDVIKKDGKPAAYIEKKHEEGNKPVSYTHLTLPTKA